MKPLLGELCVVIKKLDSEPRCTWIGVSVFPQYSCGWSILFYVINHGVPNLDKVYNAWYTVNAHHMLTLKTKFLFKGEIVLFW